MNEETGFEDTQMYEHQVWRVLKNEGIFFLITGK